MAGGGGSGQRAAAGAGFATRPGDMRWVVVGLGLGLVGCGLPRDPGGTSARVRQEGLRVGVVAGAPPPAVAAEAAAAERLARAAGAPRVVWVVAPERDLVELLRARRLALVIGARERGHPLARSVGVTRPIYRGVVAVGAPRGGRRPPRGAPVGVALGSRWEVAVARRGYRPRPAPVPTPPWWAGPGWALGRRGWIAVDTLGALAYVWWTPPGENAWLLAVERFLTAERPRLRAALESRR